MNTRMSAQNHRIVPKIEAQSIWSASQSECAALWCPKQPCTVVCSKVVFGNHALLLPSCISLMLHVLSMSCSERWFLSMGFALDLLGGSIATGGCSNEMILTYLIALYEIMCGLRYGVAALLYVCNPRVLTLCIVFFSEPFYWY